MKARDVSFAASLWDDEESALFGRWFEPEVRDDARPLLFCIPGGTYNHRYWDLQVAGESYSFAEHMTTRGYEVVAIDNLGTGASSRPSRRAGLAELAGAAASAVESIRRERPPGRPVVGIGHSMGGYTLVTQQALHRSFDAIAVLGTTIGPSTMIPIPDDVLESARQGQAARVELADATEPHIPGDYVPDSRDPAVMPMFHLTDVPRHVLDADAAQTATVLPPRAAAEASVAWFASEAATEIDVPVFLAYGELDMSPAPHEDPAAYTGAQDVTLFVLPGSAHCHNMATTRAVLWDRLDRWIHSLPTE
jgi:pimeloyl-ACP methyl ester carboxylesterase